MLNARLRIDLNNPHGPSRTTRATSQVSHNWRRLTLSLPTLWAASLDTGEEVLACAGAAPVTVVIPSFSSELGPNIEDARRDSLDKCSNLSELILSGQYCHRPTPADISTLAISLAPSSRQFYASIQDGQWEDLLQSLRRPAPNLETLALVIAYEEWPVNFDEEQGDF